MCPLSFSTFTSTVVLLRYLTDNKGRTRVNFVSVLILSGADTSSPGSSQWGAHICPGFVPDLSRRRSHWIDFQPLRCADVGGHVCAVVQRKDLMGCTKQWVPTWGSSEGRKMIYFVILLFILWNTVCNLRIKKLTSWLISCNMWYGVRSTHPSHCFKGSQAKKVGSHFKKWDETL